MYNVSMNRKSIIMVATIAGMTLGAFVPRLWGDHDMLGGMSILCGMIGGFIGVWIGVKVAKFLG